ncbi:anti-sigma factor [Actinomadura sp. KC216]|uniref:anti-sigma factor n=1 Tax=Actinomadura sp. KC216 TaxID=2530370 RepID=UPI001045CBC2|nr:anti-sigma factor [Actinomadura sp. KC216]TDB76535.1 anti-sigma factor [Actinomadura sp. KC216]
MREDVHALAGAYALDAIDDAEERRLFESHLAGCETCAAELSEFRATAARLGVAVAEAPPPRLRGRVLADIRRVRQLPPVTPGLPPDAPAQPPDAPNQRPDMTLQGPDAPNRPPDTQSEARARVEPIRSRRWRRAAVAGLAAAACLVTAVSVAEAVRERQRVEQAEDAYRDVASVLSAPDARSATGIARGGGTVTIVASASRGRVVVASSGLPGLPSARAYQLWLIDGNGARPAGLLPADGTRAVVAGTWRPADKLGVTVEPAGGSARPTTEPIVLVETT